MSSPTGQRVEVVRGRLDSGLEERLVGFWTGRGALPEPAARQRLGEVVCVLLDGDEIVGVNSAYPEQVPLVGRRFWVYRRFLATGVDEGVDGEMLKAARDALAGEFTGAPGEPLGLCALIGDRELIRRRPEAVWPDSGLVFAGYAAEGVQVRISYFDQARIGEGGEDEVHADLEEGYRLLPFSEAAEVDEEAVIEFWDREGAMPRPAARERVGEVAFVALEDREGLVAVSTVYLKKDPRLQMELWNYRTFVAERHRQGALARNLLIETREHLERRFVSGQDARAQGLMIELESELLKRIRNKAVWPRTRLTFVGENEHGDHCRVYYFPGALVPQPA